MLLLLNPSLSNRESNNPTAKKQGKRQDSRAVIDIYTVDAT